MAGMRLPLWTVALACAALMPMAVQAQVLKQRYPGRSDCPDTHLRLTARHPDGSPAAGLHPQDLYLWFSNGTADIRSIESGAAIPDTNLLIVLRPGATLAQSDAEAVMRSLQAAANLHWKIAVLAPDGSVSPFTAATDEGSLHHAFSKATATVTDVLGVADWPAAERTAFHHLKTRPGRHVILELAPPSGASGAAGNDPEAVAQDHTLDLLARDDMAQIYSLTAAGKEEFAATGGRGAPTIPALLQGIIADAPGSYDLTIHPRFSCQPGSSYSLRITSFRPDVQLFYPSAIRMASESSK
jgi:hypothetical protein